ncbi:hypothetical protein CL658_01950 [bacterium]|nr:hypothetical protein [bacterium]
MKQKDLDSSPLGKIVNTPEKYNKDILVAIQRNLDYSFKAYGMDRWTAYELSWLNKAGIPQIRICEISYNASSSAIIESKSLKLYFNAFNNSHYDSEKTVLKTIQNDLQDKVKSTVNVSFRTVQDESINPYKQMFQIEESVTQIDSFNAFKFHDNNVEETLYTHIYRSLCPVTNQPDFATLFITYSGKQLDKQTLFNYLISSRNKNNFHEECISTIFNDLLNTKKIKELTVQGSFLRRGGIDITPIRSTLKSYKIIPRISLQ